MEENTKRPGANEENKEEGQESTQDNNKKKGGIHNNALYAASMGRPATAQVDPHSHRGFADVGTNISYEGPTAPAGGGSVGTGYTSGQTGVDGTISTDSDYDRARMGKEHKEQKDVSDDQSGNATHDEEKDII